MKRQRAETWLWWSSGKDSAWALHKLRQDPAYNVTGLVTTINGVADRVAMHAVRTELVHQQAQKLGLPLHLFEIPYPCPNGAYEEAAAQLIREAEEKGVERMAFGDLFLEDIRAYREELLAPFEKIEPVFPLWGLDTKQLADDMVEAGLKAYLTCVDPKALAPSFAGRLYDRTLLEELPESVDPCGERGEFHSFVFDAPGFRRPLEVEPGLSVERDGFVFADILSRR